jgi:AraC-like DNA-binding protein
MLPSKVEELSNKEKKSIFSDVANTLIENYIAKSNLVALKVMFYISKKDVKSTGRDKNLFTFKIDTIAMSEFCGVNKKTLQRNIKKMTETSITIVDEKKKSIEYVSIIPRAKFIDGTNNIELGMFEDIYIMCKKAVNRYTNINLNNLMKLNNKHSIRLIAILEKISQYDKHVAKRVIYSREELNGVFGTNYSKIAEIERKILKPIQKELDTLSQKSFIYQVNYQKNGKLTGRPKAVGVTIDLIKRETSNSKKDESKAFLEWVKKIRKEHVNEILLYHPEIKANLRVNPQGNLYWDNGNALSASKAKEFWSWMYDNVDRLVINLG